MPVGDHGDDVVTWKVRVASRASKSGDHEIVETEVGDLVVEIGPWARVGDLVIELAGSHGLCDDPADIGWAGLELADGSMAAADERLCTPAGRTRRSSGGRRRDRGRRCPGAGRRVRRGRCAVGSLRTDAR
jgi:hypothetical protein